MRSELQFVNWTGVIDSLLANGSVHIQGALDAELAHQIANVSKPPWHVLLPEDGPVRQSGFGSYTTVAEANQAVRNIGTRIVRELAEAAPSGLVGIPEFNEVSWTRYPAGTGFISAHRDPTAYGGIVAIATLAGRAPFRIWGGSVLGTPAEILASGIPPTYWDTAVGDLVLLCGNGWPVPKARCPMHEVGVPAEAERMIMTFRYNSRGGGGGYDTGDP